MEGKQANHSWCMDVVSHSHRGLSGDRERGGGW